MIHSVIEYDRLRSYGMKASYSEERNGERQMKYCEKCKKETDTEENKCPICNEELVEILNDEDAATIVATTTFLM